MPELPNNGMVHLSSKHSMLETVERVESTLQAKGLPILARIHHSEDAAKAGLKMRPTMLLIFGKAQSGTPLMIAAPTVAIDLPLKALIWQADDGGVLVSYNDPIYLQKRHSIPDALISNIAGIGSILEGAIR